MAQSSRPHDGTPGRLALRSCEPPADGAALRAAFAHFPQGVCGVCALDCDGRPRGLATSSFTSVSLHPPLISVCVANTSQTWPVLRTSPSLGLSVLSDAQGAACEALAGDREERFATLAWFATETGAILLEGAVLWLVGSISQELPAGDHRIVVLQLDALGSEAPREPLVFHAGRFRRLAVGHWKHQDRGGPEAL